MKKPSYMCLRSGRPIALANIELFLGKFPPIVEWRGVLYYWSEPYGGYYQFSRKADVQKITDEDVREI